MSTAFALLMGSTQAAPIRFAGITRVSRISRELQRRLPGNSSWQVRVRAREPSGVTVAAVNPTSCKGDAPPPLTRFTSWTAGKFVTATDPFTPCTAGRFETDTVPATFWVAGKFVTETGFGLEPGKAGCANRTRAGVAASSQRIVGLASFAPNLSARPDLAT